MSITNELPSLLTLAERKLAATPSGERASTEELLEYDLYGMNATLCRGATTQLLHHAVRSLQLNGRTETSLLKTVASLCWNGDDLLTVWGQSTAELIGRTFVVRYRSPAVPKPYEVCVSFGPKTVLVVNRTDDGAVCSVRLDCGTAYRNKAGQTVWCAYGIGGVVIGYRTLPPPP